MSGHGDVVLEAENVGKYFKIYSNPLARLKEWVTFGKRSYHKDFWALKDVSFEIRRGGFLGIIGPNGAGKSTLLKVITGVLEPSSGSYKTNGKVLSLLELSGGMEAELSGRENIIRSAQLLGFQDGYIEERMDEIRAFAELDDFFDQPMRVYSSGMRIRLAFSMFAFIECDVLILDEVLAVGDIFFRQKCYLRLEELIKQDVAIILATHSTGIVRQYCQDVLVLHNGEVIHYGDTGEGIKKYFLIKQNQGIQIKASDTFLEEDYVSSEDVSTQSDMSSLEWPSDTLFSQGSIPSNAENEIASLIQLAICDERGVPCRTFYQGETAYFCYAYLLKESIGVPISRLNLLTVTNLIIHGKNSLQLNVKHPEIIKKGDILRYKQSISLNVAPGNYVFNLLLSTMHPNDFAERDSFSRFEFREKMVSVLDVNPAGSIEIITKNKGKAVGLHGGMCNLNGTMKIQVVSPD